MMPGDLPLVLRDYRLWVSLNQVGNWELTRMRNEAPHLTYKPLISILMPVYNTERAWLKHALDSVMGQTYPYWELCICDDGSTEDYIRETLDLYGRLDDRIKVHYLEKNEGIVRATNQALSMAEGEFVGMLDHDDELASEALFEVVRFLKEHPEADLVYSDEDKIDEDGGRVAPHLKIGWSPDLAAAANYLNHFSVYRRTVLEEVGGWREGFDGAQDLELVQRYGERTAKIHHLPKVLYHWRMTAGSTAVGADSKPYTHEKARRAVEDGLRRKGVVGSVKDGFAPNTFRVEREIIGEPPVSAILPTAGGVPDGLIENLKRHTSYQNYEILLLDLESGTLSGHQDHGEPETLEQAEAGNRSGLLNAAVRKAVGEYILILDPDLEATSEGWLENMLQHAQRTEVGAVGARLLLPSGQIFQAGLRLVDDGAEGAAGDILPHFYRNCDQPSLGYRHFWDLARNCSAVSSDCVMFRKSVFEEIGGFDEAHLGGEFADVDACLRMQESGHLIVYTPYAEFTYRDEPPRHPGLDPAEAGYIRERWGTILDEDPYYNPILTWEPSDPLPTRPAPKKNMAPAELLPTKLSQGPAQFPQPFFIVGHGRSGTTWLELTLNTHPEVLCKGSGMFFGRDLNLLENQRTLPSALENCENLRVWHGMRPNYWSERSFEQDLPGYVKALTDHVLGTELERSGKKIVGDRTPHHVSFLEEIHELYPDSKIIHIIRDGRDVAVSNIHAFWQNARDRGGPMDLDPEILRKRNAYLNDRETFISDGESIFTEPQIVQLAKTWNWMVSRGRHQGRELFGNHYVEVRYENLLQDSSSELERLFEFLGVERDRDVVERIVEENSFERATGRPRGKEDSTSFNRKGVAGDWKEVFTERDNRVFQNEAGPLLAELGYEKDIPLPKPRSNGVSKKTSSKIFQPAVVKARDLRTNPPFFVVGHGRSGTTWLERTLNTHPEVLCKGSGMFFGRSIGLFEGRKTLYATLASSDDLQIWHGMRPNYWSERSFEQDLPGYVKALTDHVLGTELERSGKKIVGDRTPHHVSFLEEIHELYPDSKIIHIIRDGRDVAVSNIHASWNSARDKGGPVDLEPEEIERRNAYLSDREGFLKERQSIFVEPRIRQLAKSWNTVVSKGRRDGKALFGDDYFEIRYESLLDNPSHELENLFGVLGVSQTTSTVDRIVEENRFEKRSGGRSRGEEDSASFLRKGVHGDWEGVLSERDREIFKKHAGELLIKLGYEKDLNW